MEDPRVARILDIVARETLIERSKLVPDALIKDLGIASLDFIELIFKLETEFDIEIPADKTLDGDKATVQMLIDRAIAAIDARGAEPAAGLRTSAG